MKPSICSSKIFSLGILLFLFRASLLSQGLIVNEVSNGPAGAQEYFELVVVGPTLNPNCGPVDIRGWIVDDNNGDFSCGACAGTGIAAGHYRFGIQPVWASVPTGSVIVLYDPAIKNPKIPADDPNDTSPADGVYILPTSHATIDGSALPCVGGNIPLPLGACGSCTGNSGYLGACYTSGFAGTNAGLRNTGDAAQTRSPNGAYFHGLGYGNGASLINGGADGLFFPVDGTGMYFSFTNAVSNNFRAIANFASGTVASNGESPGTANSVANAAWIAFLKTPCPLPVSYLVPLQGQVDGTNNVLTWTTASEVNSAYFEIERSHSRPDNFARMGTRAASGTSQIPISYEFVDANPGQGSNWYRLKQIDHNGEIQLSEVVELVNPLTETAMLDAWPNPAGDWLHVRANTTQIGFLMLRDALGRNVWQSGTAGASNFEATVDLRNLPQGNYFLQFYSQLGITTEKVLVIHP